MVAGLSTYTFPQLGRGGALLALSLSPSPYAPLRPKYHISPFLPSAHVDARSEHPPFSHSHSHTQTKKLLRGERATARTEDVAPVDHFHHPRHLLARLLHGLPRIAEILRGRPLAEEKLMKLAE